MWQNAHDAYLESRTLSADPMELVRLLYQAATGAVRQARQHLASGEIPERARAISKACEVLIELATSLDYERGGEISRNLARLYDYMHRRLIQANYEQSDQPLQEVLGLLNTLYEAWDGIRQPAPDPTPAEAPSAWAIPQDTPAGRASQAWSF
jgi:flagellar protein FliS